MASNLRRSKRTVGKRITDIDKKVERLRKANIPTQIANNVISDTNLSADITANKITAGTLIGVEIKAGTPYGSPIKYPFSVSSAGVVNAVSGTVGAFTLSTSSLTATQSFSLDVLTDITTTVSLATSGQIYTKYDVTRSVAGPYYTEIFLNKYQEDGSIIIRGDKNGSLATTKIGPSYLEAGGYVRHSSDNEGRFYGEGTYTYVGGGGANFWALRIKNGSNVYSNELGAINRRLFVDSGGEIGVDESTSSIRYKQDVSNLNINYLDVLQIQPVSFLYKKHVEELGEDAQVKIGVIAEQVESIGSLEQLLIRNESGDLESFKYEELPVHLLEVCRKQEEAIENLKARVAELEASK